MDAPTAIDGSDGPLLVRRIVVWRRLEQGDVRTPGTEQAPESPYLEAKVLEVGVAKSLHEEMTRLWKVRDEVTGLASHWTTRYEPAGALFAGGGGLAVGVLLDYLPLGLLPFALSLVVLGIAVGLMTRARKAKAQSEADRAWRDTPQRKELERIEKTLTPRWERFSTRLREETSFRTDVRVGDIHEADRLVSIDVSRISHPDTWAPDDKPHDVRYGWAYHDGRVVMQVAETEDSAKEGAPTPEADDDAEPEDDASEPESASEAAVEAPDADDDEDADDEGADDEGADDEDADDEGADDEGAGDDEEVEAAAGSAIAQKKRR